MDLQDVFEAACVGSVPNREDLEAKSMKDLVIDLVMIQSKVHAEMKFQREVFMRFAPSFFGASVASEYPDESGEDDPASDE